MKSKVTKKQCLDAIEYLFTMGFIDEMNYDQRHYTRILLEKVSSDYKIELVWDDEE
tara:strand:- start:5682 stop:5849 length:168 start_codon:yes stop_codon:yes gene_type:complete